MQNFREYIQIGYNNNTSEGITSIINKLMISIGEAKVYEEYGAMPSTEFQSKIRSCGDNINLLDIYDLHATGYSITSNGVGIEFLENGAIKLNGTPTKAFSIPILGTYQSGNYKLDLNGNCTLDGLTQGCGIAFFNGTNNVADFAINNKVVEIKQKIDYAILSIKANASFDNAIIQPKLEQGTVATSYSKFGEGNVNFIICNKKEENESLNEYKEQNYTFPLKQKFHKDDYLAEDGIHHIRKEIVLDGVTNNLKVYNVVKHESNIYYCTISLPKTALNGSRVYCSHFKNKNQSVVEGNCYITGGGGILVLVLEDQTITTAEQANEWLAGQKANGTSVTINYLLAVEELEEYSTEQKEAYNKLMQARSYKEKTHIYSTDPISPKFDVEYCKDLELFINSKLATTTVVEEAQ